MTPKRRPVIRVVFASLVAVAIVGASVSSASIGDVDQLADAANEANIESGFVATKAGDGSTTSETEPELNIRIDESEADLDEPEADLVAIEHRLLSLKSAAFTHQVQTRLDAQADAEATLQVAAIRAGINAAATIAAEADEAAAVQAELDAAADAAAAENQARVVALSVASAGERAALLADELGLAQTEAEAQAAWDAGYAIGGGSNLSAFHNTILPCESGSQKSRDTAVGATDDWGRSQVNRPVWRTTFQDLTGEVFEEGIVKPALNGYMAAYIENVQGLTAWTCWRNR